MTFAPWTCEWCLHDPCCCDEIAAWNAEHLASQLQQPSSSSVVVDAQEEEEQEDEYEGRCPWCRSAPCHCEETVEIRLAAYEADVQALEALREPPPAPIPTPTRTYK